MKKILSLLIVLAMVLALAPAVFAEEAATTATVVTDLTTLTDGQYVIFAPGYGKALSSETASQYYQKGIDVTVTDGVLTGFGATSIWDLTVNEDGTISIAQDGQKLGMAADKSSMKLGAVNDTWTVVDLEQDGLVNLKNVGRGNYMEWYAKYGNWSTYNSSSAATDKQFQLQFARIDTEEEAATLTLGDNYIELLMTATEASTYTFTAEETGTLYVVATDFLYRSDDSQDFVDNTAYMNEWAMYTIFSVNGTPFENGYYGSVDVVAGETYTFTWEHSYMAGYSWAATINLSYSDELIPKMGSADMPVELSSYECPTNSIEIAAGEVAYYSLWQFGGTNFTVTGENAYVLVEEYDMMTGMLNEIRYDAIDGVVTVPISSMSWGATMIRIGNAGTEPAVFGLNFYFPLGSWDNPATLVAGENIAATVENDYAGYFFQFTAEDAGTLTLTFSADVDWVYAVNNQTTGVYGDAHYSNDEEVVNPFVIEFAAGDVLQIQVNSFDPATYTNPGGDISVFAVIDYVTLEDPSTGVEPTPDPNPNPDTGDMIFAVLSILAVSGMGITAVVSKKN